MAVGDLATLTDVKAWLNIADTSSDAVLSRLITALSQRTLAYLQRGSLISSPRVDLRDGTGTQLFLLRDWPVTAVSSVVVDGATIPQAPAPPTDSTLGYTTMPTGWTLSAYEGQPPGSNQTITLCGYDFCYGRKNVQVSYTAGYLVSDEASSVPVSPFVYQVQAPQGPWAADSGVVFTDTGAVGVLVTGTPTTGQYAIVPAPAGGQPGGYQFAAADVGRPIAVSYSFVPSDLEQIVIDWVASRNSARSRIDQKSKSLGGQETMSWDLSGIPAYVIDALAPWRSVVPLPP